MPNSPDQPPSRGKVVLPKLPAARKGKPARGVDPRARGGRPAKAKVRGGRPPLFPGRTGGR